MSLLCKTPYFSQRGIYNRISLLFVQISYNENMLLPATDFYNNTRASLYSIPSCFTTSTVIINGGWSLSTFPSATSGRSPLACNQGPSWFFIGDSPCTLVASSFGIFSSLLSTTAPIQDLSLVLLQPTFLTSSPVFSHFLSLFLYFLLFPQEQSFISFSFPNTSSSVSFPLQNFTYMCSVFLYSD